MLRTKSWLGEIGTVARKGVRFGRGTVHLIAHERRMAGWKSEPIRSEREGWVAMSKSGACVERLGRSIWWGRDGRLYQ